MCVYLESPGNKLLGLVGSIISCIYVWPIDGVYKDALKHVENKAMYALMYDFYVLNKPLSLDSSLTARSTVSNNPGLTIMSAGRVRALCLHYTAFTIFLHFVALIMISL